MGIDLDFKCTHLEESVSKLVSHCANLKMLTVTLWLEEESLAKVLGEENFPCPPQMFLTT